MQMKAEVLPDVKVSVEIGDSVDVQLAVTLIKELTKFRDHVQAIRAGKVTPSSQPLVVVDENEKAQPVEIVGDKEAVIAFCLYIGELLQLRLAWLRGEPLPPVPDVLTPQMRVELSKLKATQPTETPDAGSDEPKKETGSLPHASNAEEAIPYMLDAFRKSVSLNTIILLGCVVKHFRMHPGSRSVTWQELMLAMQPYWPAVTKVAIRNLIQGLCRRMRRLFTSTENELAWLSDRMTFTPTFVRAVEEFHQILPENFNWRTQLDRILGEPVTVVESTADMPVEPLAANTQVVDEPLDVGDWGSLKGKLVNVREHIIDANADPKSKRIYRVVDYDREKNEVTFMDTILGTVTTVSATLLDGNVYL